MELSKVLDLKNDPEVIDYCSLTECSSEIHFGQMVTKKGSAMYCSTKCFAKAIGAVEVTALS